MAPKTASTSQTCLAAVIWTAKTTIYPRFQRPRSQYPQQGEKQAKRSVTFWHITTSQEITPVYSEIASKGLTSTKIGNSHAKWRYLPSFCHLLPRDARRFSPRIPWRSLRNAPLPTSSRAENLILTPSTGTDLSPRLEFYRSFCSKIILHLKT